MREQAKVDVLIIGGGASGLAAAAALSRSSTKEKIRAVLLEAQDRPGGRILTINDHRFPLPVELGAEFIHGRPDRMWELAHEAEAGPYNVPHHHWMQRGGRLEPIKLGEHLERVFGRLKRTGRDRSFQDFIQREKWKRSDRDSLRLARWFVHGFEAADPERFSAKSMAQQWREMGNFEDQPQHRLLHGYGAVIEHLLWQIDSRGGAVRILLRTQVTDLRWTRGRVEAIARTGGKKRTFHARAAILALPLSAWHAGGNDPHHINFDPQLNSKRDAAAQLGFGPVVKAVLAFREPFWEDPKKVKAAKRSQSLIDAAYVHAPGADFPTWWTAAPLHVPMLTLWAGGPDAKALSGHTEKHLISTALDTLCDVLRQRRRTIEPLLLAGRACDWSAMPFIHGAYSYEAVGGEGAGKQLAEPIEDTLFFAGEATSADQPSTVAGAIESGERAAREAMRGL